VCAPRYVNCSRVRLNPNMYGQKTLAFVLVWARRHDQDIRQTCAGQVRESGRERERERERKEREREREEREEVSQI
jgi:hypothetical protein